MASAGLEQNFNRLSPQRRLARRAGGNAPRRLEARGVVPPRQGGAINQIVRRIFRYRGVEIPSGRVETARRAMRLGAEQQVASRGCEQAAETICKRKRVIRRARAQPFRSFSGKRSRFLAGSHAERVRPYRRRPAGVRLIAGVGVRLGHDRGKRAII